MVITFQVIMILVLLISFIGVVGEKDNENLRASLTGVCIASVVALVVTFFIL
ncbi:hypothetical protein [Alkalihalophilus marmarensis]|uniref:hypothetical protein n=1 Tax=Alkalihalophilus marmarensis TaxID=521377 RepID=UPI002E247DAC|nr:hypothetical protein [Alkalihalophilus marmarensis]